MKHAPATSFAAAQAVSAGATPTAPIFHRNLEALRGIAALLVVLHHLSLTPGSWLAAISPLHEGWLFVDQFFVLSGFVIASVHLGIPATGGAAKRFLVRRFFRLYPLHAATLAAALVVDVASGSAALPGYGVMLLFNLTLVHSWGMVPGSVLNGPSWSISAEWGAYLVMAGVGLVTASPRRRLALLGLVGAASFLSLVVWRGGSLDGDLLFRLPRCLMSFALGAGVWAWGRDRASLGRTAATIVQGAAAAGMAALLLSTAAHPRLTLMMPLLSALMIAAMARDPGSGLRRALETAGPQWLGRHSYSLYLVHMPLFHLLLLATPGGWPASPGLATGWIAGALAALLAVSALTYRLIESPGRALGRHLSERIAGAH